LDLGSHKRRTGAPRRFLDFIVDSESIYDRHGYDLISCLGWFVPAQDALAAGRLLLEEPPEFEDRVSVYVCPDDGDPCCGALTVIIDRRGNEIVWSEPAYSTYDLSDEGWTHEPLPSWATWGQLHFPVGEYLRAIRERPPSGWEPGGPRVS